MVLLGPSGCGKSTVLRMVAGLEDPTVGRVLLDGELANDLPPRERKVAMVFQDFGLYPHMTVRDNIGFPLRHRRPRAGAAGTSGSPTSPARWASATCWPASPASSPAASASGSRWAARSCAGPRSSSWTSRCPTSTVGCGPSCGPRSPALVRELGVTTIYVTHDQAEALTMADRVAILRKGVLQDVGTPTQVYSRPGTLYVAAFLGSPRMNLLEASVYVHLDRYIALHLGEQALLPALERHAGPPGRALPRRAHRGRRAGRGAHPGRAGHHRATSCTAGSATSSTTATSRWRSSTSARPP